MSVKLRTNNPGQLNKLLFQKFLVTACAIITKHAVLSGFVESAVTMKKEDILVNKYYTLF